MEDPQLEKSKPNCCRMLSSLVYEIPFLLHLTASSHCPNSIYAYPKPLLARSTQNVSRNSSAVCHVFKKPSIASLLLLDRTLRPALKLMRANLLNWYFLSLGITLNKLSAITDARAVSPFFDR